MTLTRSTGFFYQPACKDRAGMERRKAEVDIRQQFLDRASDHIFAARGEECRLGIIGQSGSGKSTLVNTVTGASLKTDPLRPCTQGVQEIELAGPDGSKLRFYDTAGLGEASAENNARHLAAVRRLALGVSPSIPALDSLMLTMHADQRDIGSTIETLHGLADGQPIEEGQRLFRTITFVATKADLATSTPWGYGQLNGKGIFTPGPANRELLQAKADYFRDAIHDAFPNILSARTFQDSPFPVRDSRFTLEYGAVIFNGRLTTDIVTDLSRRHPETAPTLQRLYQGQQVIPVSARYRYNLLNLLAVVVGKASGTAALRLEKFINVDAVQHVGREDAEKLRNIHWLASHNR